jgi:hypothetical protein
LEIYWRENYTCPTFDEYKKMVYKSKDSTELWVGFNCTCEKWRTERSDLLNTTQPHPPPTPPKKISGYVPACEFVYFIAYYSMCTFQCCHVQCCGHGPLLEMKIRLSDQTFVCHCKPSEHMYYVENDRIKYYDLKLLLMLSLDWDLKHIIS